MRRDDHHVVPGELAHDVCDELDAGPIEVRLRLVEKKERCVAAQHARKSDALALTNGERVGADLERIGAVAIQRRREADSIEGPPDPVVGGFGSEKAHGSSNARAGREVGPLRKKRDSCTPGIDVEIGQIDAVDPDRPGPGCRERQQETQTGALAGAVHARQAEDVAPVPGERDIAKHVDVVCRRPVVPEGHAFERDRGR